jgi:hypothetical protein
MAKFSAQHHNAIAKIFKENMARPDLYTDRKGEYRIALTASGGQTRIAIALAEYFERDNPVFDPIKFLETCSPNPEKMPLGELWPNTPT